VRPPRFDGLAGFARPTGSPLLSLRFRSTRTEENPVLDIQFDAASSGPDFAISASREVVGTEQGGHADFSVFVDPLSGFGSAVSLSILGLPSGVAVNFPHSMTPGATSVGVTVARWVPAGSYSLIVTGRGTGGPTFCRSISGGVESAHAGGPSG
jgi:hypothetical protein